MPLCVEPGAYIPGFGGIKMEDDLIVTTGEPEIISHTTRELTSIWGSRPATRRALPRSGTSVRSMAQPMRMHVCASRRGALE